VEYSSTPMAPPPRDSAPPPSDDAPPTEPVAAAAPASTVPLPPPVRSPRSNTGEDSEDGGPRFDPQKFERGARMGRYMLLKPLGEGGMGVVYAAYDPELDRKVALKLLRTDPQGPEPTAGRARLLREAQAMARISHPNVCAVYDAGTFQEQIFIAMEFVEGTTLHDWLAAKPRPWRELLRVFIEAGQGLAAAHEAGLVHRDFKPGNVLIGKGERALVTDFGLARLTSMQEEDKATVELILGSAPSSALNSAVTRADIVMGTPTYMPPEQYMGITPDARSDQFSFCAALFWSLYSLRPFEPQKVYEAARVLASERPGGAAVSLPSVVQEPPARSEVPAWVRRAVLRGLSLRPQERFPSMRELLEALAQEPRRARRRRVLLGTGLAVVAAVGAGVALRRGGPVCEGAEQQVAQVWNPGMRGQLEAAFTATGRPFAREAARSVGQVLDGYARDWARQHTEACVATRVQGVQTEMLLSLRAVCLERRRKELGATVRLLAAADARLVTRAVDVAHSLPSLLECQDIDSLSAVEALPAEPTQRARVEQLDAELAELQALARAGRYDDFLKGATKLEPEVAATGYLPLRAELQASLGWTQQRMGKADEGARRLEQAVNDAEVARADRLKASALSQLLFVRGIQGQAEQAEQWARLAESTIARLGGDAQLSAQVKGNLGNVALRQGRYAEAQRYFEETRKLQEGVLSPEHPHRSQTTYNLGLVALLIGEPSRAVQLLAEALRDKEAALGPQHPEVANCHNMLAWAHRDAGDTATSLRHAEQALTIRKAVFGEAHPLVADALDARGMTLIKLERYDEARTDFETALALKQKALGPDSQELSFSYDGIGQALLAAGRAGEAVAPLRKALSFEDVEPEPLAESGFALARALVESGGALPEALAEARKAQERFTQLGKKARATEVETWLQAQAQPVKASFRPAPGK